jgi:hypothetical protein
VRGQIGIDQNYELPAGVAPSPTPACGNSLSERKRYEDGASVTRTQKSVGVRLELPFRLRWLAVAGDPDRCQIGPDTWAGPIFSLGSAGPTSDAEIDKLKLALTP